VCVCVCVRVKVQLGIIEQKLYINMFSHSRCLQRPECYDSCFRFEKRGPVKMKGRKDPMICWVLTRKTQ